MSIIALLSDFGQTDWYVASMKGVIHSIARDSTVVDITHEIPPGNVAAGAFVLRQCFRDFPRGTIFVGVVDPGVGTSRDAIAISAVGFYFVGPDNGLLGFLAEENLPSGFEIRSVQNSFCIRRLLSEFTLFYKKT